MLRTQYTGNNNEVIFFRNDVAINWSGISSDTPVGEGGSGGNCPSQNLVDMYDMADGSSPFKQYDATGAPVYAPGSLTPAINAESGYNDADMWANRDPRLSATVLYQGTPWGTMRDNSTIDVRPGMADNPTGNANATPYRILYAQVYPGHNPQLQPWRLGLSPLDNHPLCRDSYELCRGSK